MLEPRRVLRWVWLGRVVFSCAILVAAVFVWSEAAPSEPVIDVFDTYCYRKIATIPIRDPIIGPVRATTRPNGQLVLVGATIRGVTVVALPDNFTTTCQ